MSVFRSAVSSMCHWLGISKTPKLEAAELKRILGETPAPTDTVRVHNMSVRVLSDLSPSLLHNTGALVRRAQLQETAEAILSSTAMPVELVSLIASYCIPGSQLYMNSNPPVPIHVRTVLVSRERQRIMLESRIDHELHPEQPVRRSEAWWCPSMQDFEDGRLLSLTVRGFRLDVGVAISFIDGRGSLLRYLDSETFLMKDFVLIQLLPVPDPKKPISARAIGEMRKAYEKILALPFVSVETPALPKK